MMLRLLVCSFRHMLLPALLLVALGTLGLAGFPQEGGPSLIVPADEIRDPAVRAVRAMLDAQPQAAVVRERLVTVDVSPLVDTGRDVSAPEATRLRLRLDLFDDTVVTAVVDRYDEDPAGLVWMGHLEGIEPSAVTFVSRRDQVAGSVVSPRGAYAIRWVDGALHVVAEIDQSRLPREADAVPVDVPADSPVLPASLDAMPDDGSRIDVLVLYTAAARAWAGSTAAMLTRIDLGIAETNQSYASSGVSQTVRLVSAQEVPSYAESDDLTADLNAITNPGDPAIGARAAALRDAYGADLVVLVTSPFTPQYCGIAWLMGTVSSGFASHGFSVVANECISPNYSLAHEMGHNMGVRHDWYVDWNTTPYAYAHGFVRLSGGWRTIMAYNDQCASLGYTCTRLPYWSNPDVNYGGLPMGVAPGTSTGCPSGLGQTACDADARRVLNNTAYTVANFRQTVSAPAPPVVTKHPANVTIVVGNLATLTAAAAGSPAPTPQWQVSVDGGATWSNALSWGGIVGDTFYYNAGGAYTDVRIRVTYANALGSATSNPATLTVVPDPGPSVKPIDFNRDGQADIFWRNYLTGASAQWLMNGPTVVESSSLPVAQPFESTAWKAAGFAGSGSLLWQHAATGECRWAGSPTAPGDAYPSRMDPAWQVVAFSTFDGDAYPDVLERNAATGENALSYIDRVTAMMTGFYAVGSRVALPTVADTAWRVGGVVPPTAGAWSVFWRNQFSGVNAIWRMQGTTISDVVTLPQVADSSWVMSVVTDVNGDGHPDVIWRNMASGANVVWYLSGGTLIGSAVLPSVTDTHWRMTRDWSGQLDFNADGKPDLVFRDRGSGQNVVWHMSGDGLAGYAMLPAVGDTNWTMAAVTDMNADNHPDLVWRNAATGDNLVWFLNGAALSSYALLPAVSDTAWQIGAVADLNADGSPDIVWRHAGTGANLVWWMNGATLSGYVLLPTVGDTAWTIVGAGDFNYDGQPDLLWRNHSTGDVVVWYMNGAELTGSAFLPAVRDTNWEIAAIRDLNLDGHPDLVWRNYSTGANLVWYMRGIAIAGSASLPTVASTGYVLVR